MISFYIVCIMRQLQKLISNIWNHFSKHIFMVRGPRLATSGNNIPKPPCSFFLLEARVSSCKNVSRVSHLACHAGPGPLDISSWEHLVTMIPLKVVNGYYNTEDLLSSHNWRQTKACQLISRRTPRRVFSDL